MLKNEDPEFALRKLIRLQELEDKISKLRYTVSEAPKQIERLDSELDKARQRMSEAEEAIETAGQNRRTLESEVEDLRGKLRHYKEQLMEVKTNTEYQAMLHEISFVESRISEKEDLILEEMLEADELDSNLETAKQAFLDRKKEIEAERQALQASCNQSETELKALEDERKDVETKIPTQHMERYKRIAAVRGGVALAVVENHSCAACHVRLRPQLLAEVRMNREIILCENCNRILYHSAS
jgi:predicted  nucleic acid-binding Zn-ribbon protein